MLCRARLDVYLFERSKNYRSGAATRRCLPFDREATTREFARYLPRETSKPLRSAPLRSALPCAVRMSARAQCICITGNALTHFNPSLHRRFFSLLFSLFSLLHFFISFYTKLVKSSHRSSPKISLRFEDMFYA